MAKTETSAKPGGQVKAQQGGVLAPALKPTYDLPDYLQPSSGGAEQFAQYIVPPRFKVVQKQADDSLLQKFNPGDVLLMQQGVDPLLVAPVRLNENGRPGDDGTPFHLVPIFFFVEWVTWNPIEWKGTQPAIVERTIDPLDPLVAKCRNPKRRQEECGKDGNGKPIYLRHVEHLNFVMMIAGKHQLAGMHGVLGFSRGEHSRGTAFMALHNKRQADLWACVYEARVGKRPGSKGQWHGIDMQNPSTESGVAPFVTREQLELTKQLHDKLKEAHAKNLIVVDYETEPSDDDSAPRASHQF